MLISRTFGQGFRHSRSALRELLPSREERREALVGGRGVGQSESELSFVSEGRTFEKGESLIR